MGWLLDSINYYLFSSKTTTATTSPTTTHTNSINPTTITTITTTTYSNNNNNNNNSPRPKGIIQNTPTMTPSDETLLEAHNKISSSTSSRTYSTNNNKDVCHETKQIIHQYPQVLSYHVLDWGGSIVLHTVCSRQPNNYKLIRYLVEKGMECNVGATHTSAGRSASAGRSVNNTAARGGLLVQDYYNRTPLNILVGKNAIQTLRKLQQSHVVITTNSDNNNSNDHNSNNSNIIINNSNTDNDTNATATPTPMLVPYDVINSRLFNSVHSTYHVDMVRFLIHLYPQSISKPHSIHNHQLLLYYLCSTISDTRFLLRIVPILIEEGIIQKVGGEYGIGGLFESLSSSLPSSSSSSSCTSSWKKKQKLNADQQHAHPNRIMTRVNGIDLLIRKREQSWNIIGPIIRGIITDYRAPILHAAILHFDKVRAWLENSFGSEYGDDDDVEVEEEEEDTNEDQYELEHELNHSKLSSMSFIQMNIHGICHHIENSVLIHDSKGQLAIHVGAEYGLRWVDDHMEDIVKANMSAVKVNDPITGLPVYALAALGMNSSLCSIYELMSLCVDDFS